MEVIDEKSLDGMVQDMSIASGLIDLLVCNNGHAEASNIAALTVVQQLVDKVGGLLVDEFRSPASDDGAPKMRSLSPPTLHIVS